MQDSNTSNHGCDVKTKDLSERFGNCCEILVSCKSENLISHRALIATLNSFVRVSVMLEFFTLIPNRGQILTGTVNHISRNMVNLIVFGRFNAIARKNTIVKIKTSTGMNFSVPSKTKTTPYTIKLGSRIQFVLEGAVILFGRLTFFGNVMGLWDKNYQGLQLSKKLAFGASVKAI
jgi:hypothetical protein